MTVLLIWTFWNFCFLFLHLHCNIYWHTLIVWYCTVVVFRALHRMRHQMIAHTLEHSGYNKLDSWKLFHLWMSDMSVKDNILIWTDKDWSGFVIFGYPMFVMVYFQYILKDHIFIFIGSVWILFKWNLFMQDFL